MNSKSAQIALAVFAGIFIGLVTAYSVNPVIWWVGILVGALAGYVLYSPREAYQATKHVMREIHSLHCELKEDEQYKIEKSIGYLLKFTATWAFTILSWVYIPIYIHWLSLPNHNVSGSVFALGGTLAFLWMATIVFAGMCRHVWKEMDAVVHFLPKFEESGNRRLEIKTNPLWFSFPGMIVQVILNTLVILVSLVKFAFWVVFTVVKVIHSAERVQCAGYSALGVAVGYFYNGSPIIFALGGALVGTLVWRLVTSKFVSPIAK